jgi:hypothetical protein
MLNHSLSALSKPKADPVANFADRSFTVGCRAVATTVDNTTSSLLGAVCLALVLGAAVDLGVVQKVQPGFGPEKSSQAYPFYLMGLASAFSGIYWGSRATIQGLTSRATRPPGLQ